jgi:hypothetical protein
MQTKDITDVGNETASYKVAAGKYVYSMDSTVKLRFKGPAF